MICLQISIFELLNTTGNGNEMKPARVVICLQISIFELLNTTSRRACLAASSCDLLTN